MEPDLRKHFDRAVSFDPGGDPAELAGAAMAQGSRIRRRRRQWAVTGAAAAVVTVLAVVSGAGLLTGEQRPDPATTIPAAMMMPPGAPSCSLKPVERDATDVALFLRHEITDRQRSALGAALDDDPAVEASIFESRAAAYEKFRELWADSPDFVASVGPQQLPEAYRVRLVDPAGYAGFHARYATMAGVQEIVGRACPPSAPVGGM